MKGHYELDHFLPQARSPQTTVDYDNLLYACSTCNSAKGGQLVPDPCTCLLRGQVVIQEDGSILGRSSAAKRIIRVLGLDDAEYREFRRIWIDIVALARFHNPDLFRRLINFPDELPDLSLLRPPANSRPAGLEQSCFVQRLRGELPESY